LNRKVLILKPRLDLPFKKFGLERRNNNPLPPIREHWKNFVDRLKEHHERCGDKVIVIEEQRWKFNNALPLIFSPDICYVPHVEKHNFKGLENCRYYMQTVIPWLFTIDPEGWGGGGSFSNWTYSCPPDDGATFKKFQERAFGGGSKFDQPEGEFHNKVGDYIFVPLQLPHDETIRWHSTVSVETMAESIAKWGARNSIPIVFKNHPINPGSLQHVKNMISQYPNCVWLESANIHSVIRQAKAVYVVNSGTGMESMLWEVPVVRFGLSEYNHAVVEGDIMNLKETYYKVCNLDKEEMIEKYKLFYNWFVNIVCFDSTNLGTFMKLR
jgi:hypothetical protein